MSMITKAFGLCLAMIMTGSAFAADEMQGMDGHGMQGEMKSGMMQEMMSNPQHKLGMAYMKNLQNFAEALKAEVTATGKVDKDFATTAVKEMRQSLKEMEKHQKEMQKSMPQEMKGKMKDMVKMMDNRFQVTRQHLDLLEKEVKAKNPGPKKVETEVDQILKQCEMMKMKGMEQMKQE